MTAIFSGTPLTTKQKVTAIRTAVSILDKWNCSINEKSSLLGVSEEALSAPPGITEQAIDPLSDETLVRVSLLLNIHATLRTLFTDLNSVYGWVRKPNSYPAFGGKSAIKVMLSAKDERGIRKILDFLNRQLEMNNMDEKTEQKDLTLLAIKALGDAKKAERWLMKPNRCLSGESPADRSKTQEGAGQVKELLYRIATGVHD